MINITSYCHISSERASLNGQIIFEHKGQSLSEFLLQLYRHLETDYPKFHKMDLLCKTAWLATEIIKRNNPRIKHYNDQEIALLFANSHSCSLTDSRFEASYKDDQNPSPAQFVYTLPNILIGELAIHNKWHGESLFSVLPDFAADFYIQQAHLLMPEKAHAIFCGWINLVPECSSFVFFAENADEHHNFGNLNKENLLLLKSENNNG
jgi:hypothetical protein